MVMTASPITEKVCHRCDTLKSLTSFYKDSQKPDGRRPECAECHKARSRQLAINPPVQEGEKTCTVCGELKPVTEYFARSRAANGRMSACKLCHELRLEAMATKDLPDGYRKCLECKEIRPVARFPNAYNKPGGKHWLCHPCTSKRTGMSHKLHPEHGRNAFQRRRARKLNATGIVTEEKLQQLALETYCCYCGDEFVQGDTRKSRTITLASPFAQGGTYNDSNLVAACRSCSTSKRTKPEVGSRL